MANTFLLIVAILWILFIIAFLYIKKVPAGWVQFKTGLVLKFLPPLDAQPVVQLRNSIEAFVTKKLPSIQKSLPVHSVRSIEIPTRHGSIDARIFEANTDKDTHLIVLIHGGGWCIGSTNTYEEVSRRLVRATGLSLISLDYGLAPEVKFPQGHNECLDAVTWIANHPDKIIASDAKLILIGDSAGGNLVITSYYDASQEVQQSIEKIIAIYPAVDSSNNNYPSNIDYGKGYYLTAKSMAQFTEALVNSSDDFNDPRLSFFHHYKEVAFGDIFILTADFDPLRDQSEAFASKLKQDGNPVCLKRYDGTIHAFYGLKDFGSKGLEAINDTASFILNKDISGLRPL